jgi:uncharacterized protein (DUF927 family)
MKGVVIGGCIGQRWTCVHRLIITLLVNIVRLECVGADGDRKKEIRPLTYCRVEDGNGYHFGWRACGVPAPRPLYHLPELLASPDAIVIIVEGEKTADAVAKIFDACATTTSMGGSRACEKTDWSPLARRRVIIWPDHDEPGRSYAKKVTAYVTAAGAKSVSIVNIPEAWPEGWDLADPLPNGIGPEKLAELLRSAVPQESYISFSSYRMSASGLYVADAEESLCWLSDPFEVLAQTRDTHGSAWGLLLRWRDPDNRLHEWAMPWRALGGAREEVWRELLDEGLSITPSTRNRNRLAEYLSTARVKSRARAVARIGWHIEDKAMAFVLPDTTYGVADPDGGRVIWQSEARADTAYSVAGTIDQWRDAVARKCIGNSRLAFSASTAFAPPLLKLINEESGGFHFVGSSRTGKTTLLHVAGSVWGGGRVKGYLRSWRATSNGLEGVAEAHCDTLLCLDEMGQVEAREAGEIAYMLANNYGKSRAARSGSARRSAEWRLLFLSSGEIPLGDKMAEIGRQPKAGQGVRLVDIPADAGVWLGAFEHLHGAESPGAFAEEIRLATENYHGTPIRRYLEVLTARHAANASQLVELPHESRRQFLVTHLPKEASPQVRSVCNRFALVAAAGSLATAMGSSPSRSPNLKNIRKSRPRSPSRSGEPTEIPRACGARDATRPS